MKPLRPHQGKAIEMLRDSLRRRKRRPVLQLGTGSGKTRISAEITKNALGNGKRVMFIADAIQLIDQTVQAFWDEGIRDIGVIQADHPMTNWQMPCQVASIQTLARRTPPDFDIAIIDEVHAFYGAHKRLMEKYPNKIYIGLSATPWTRGLGLWFDDLVQPASIRDLTELGYQAKLVAYGPQPPDLSGVTVKAGEFDEAELSEVMQGEKLVGDIVETWEWMGDDRPTLAFCVDRAHAAVVQERFQAAGTPWGYIDGDMDKDERKAVRRQLDAGEIIGVSSVGTMLKGIDWKFGTIIDAQPTRDPKRHCQKLGRLRPFAEWDHGIVLDHAGNTLLHGMPIDIHVDHLCTKEKREKSDEITAAEDKKPKGCPKCGFFSTEPKKRTDPCAKCGHVHKAVSDIEEGAGHLALVAGKASGMKSGPAKKEPTPAEKEIFFRQMLGWCRERGRPDKQAAGKFMSRYGHWPARKAGLEPLPPTQETLNWVKAQNIRYAKSKKRSA